MPTSTLSEIDLEDKNNDTIRKTTIIAPNLKGKNDLEKIAFYDKNKEENKNKEKMLKTDLDKKVNMSN